MSDNRALIAELVKLGNDVDEDTIGVPAELRAAVALTEQAATIEAIREWWSITLWAQPDWPLLMAIIYPEEGTQ